MSEFNSYPDRFNSGSIQSIYIEIYAAVGATNPVSNGTGFLLSDDLKTNSAVFLVTAKHNLTGKDFFTEKPLGSKPKHIKIFLPHTQRLTWHQVEIDVYDDEDQPLWIEHPSSKTDIAMLKITTEQLNQHGFPYKNQIVQYPQRLNVTDPISVVGFPLKRNDQYLAVWTTGSIASDPELDFHFQDKSYPFFLINAKSWKGQSGSPVCKGPFAFFSKHSNNFQCDSGGLIHLPHMYSGRLNPTKDEDDKQTSDIGIVWKNTVIREIFHHAQTLDQP